MTALPQLSGSVVPANKLFPESPRPPQSLIDAALRDIPTTMADMQNALDYGAPTPEPGQRIVVWLHFVRALSESHKHSRVAAEWAIYQLLSDGVLIARWARSLTPSLRMPDGTWSGGYACEIKDVQGCLIESTAKLWEMWHKSDLSPQVVAEPTEEPSVIVQIHQQLKNESADRQRQAQEAQDLSEARSKRRQELQGLRQRLQTEFENAWNFQEHDREMGNAPDNVAYEQWGRQFLILQP